jgi:hypothetical protein
MAEGIKEIIKSLESYPAPHLGRPGHRGGSSPRGTTQVGITSARKDERPVAGKAKADLAELTSALAKAGIKANGYVGVGGYEGGREYTFVLSYKGASEKALPILAAFAKKWKQDSVIVLPPSTGGSPVGRINFTKNPSADGLRKIEKALIEHGLGGGWTWQAQANGQRALLSAHIPQWSDFTPEQHMKALGAVNDGLKEFAGEISQTWANPIVMESGDYDRYIGG